MMSTLDTTYDGDVLRVRFDNPRSELNLFDEGAHEDWLRFAADARREDKARVILIEGTARAFTGGGDFSMFARLDGLEGPVDRLRRDARLLVWDFVNIETPIVFAGRGPAVGLGATIALLSDFVILGEGCTIIDPHVRVGLAAGDGGTGIWPLIMGPVLAKRYLMTGDPVGAAEALRLGIATEVVPDDQVVETAMAWANRLASGNALAVKYTKHALNAHIRRALIDSFDLSNALETVNFLTLEHRDSSAAFRSRKS